MRTRLIACLVGLFALVAAGPAMAQDSNDGSFSQSQSSGGGSSSSSGGSTSSSSSGSGTQSEERQNSGSGGHANSSMVGDTRTDAHQTSSSESGDAQSGSQINRVGGSAEGAVADVDAPAGAGAAAESGEVTEGPSSSADDPVSGSDSSFSSDQGQDPNIVVQTPSEREIDAEETAAELPRPDVGSWVMIGLLVLGLAFVFRKLPKASKDGS